MNQLVRVGAVAQVGRFRAVEGVLHPRGARVIVRTDRGLEIGEVLGDDSAPECDGDLLRAMTDSDLLLAARLRRDRDAAYDACVRLLSQRGVAAVLLDAELLFDGRGLYFYFLGEVDAETEALTADLAATYQAEARLEAFAETLEQGCGPGCGEENATGGGCGSCGGCAVAAACHTGSPTS